MTWTLTAPDGRQWAGDSPFKACAAAQRDTIDPALRLQRINAMVAEEQALNDAEWAPAIAALDDAWRALTLATAICDAVPSREPGHLGKLVNAQDNGSHGYAFIRDTLAKVEAFLKTVPDKSEWFGDERDSLWENAVSATDEAHSLLAAEIERLRAALLWCACQAESLKQECGTDPESPQAIRNGQYMAISVGAHIALGTIRGPAITSQPLPAANGKTLRETLLRMQVGEAFTFASVDQAKSAASQACKLYDGRRFERCGDTIRRVM